MWFWGFKFVLQTKNCASFVYYFRFFFGFSTQIHPETCQYFFSWNVSLSFFSKISPSLGFIVCRVSNNINSIDVLCLFDVSFSSFLIVTIYNLQMSSVIHYSSFFSYSRFLFSFQRFLFCVGFLSLHFYVPFHLYFLSFHLSLSPSLLSFLSIFALSFFILSFVCIFSFFDYWSLDSVFFKSFFCLFLFLYCFNFSFSCSFFFLSVLPFLFYYFFFLCLFLFIILFLFHSLSFNYLAI